MQRQTDKIIQHAAFKQYVKIHITNFKTVASLLPRAENEHQ